MQQQFKPLNREEVIKAIERKNPERVPVLIHFWNYGNTRPEHLRMLDEIMSRYPCDFEWYLPTMPGYDQSPFPQRPGYVWVSNAKKAGNSCVADAQIYLADWDMLDDCLVHFPDPTFPEIMEEAKQKLANTNPSMYKVAHFSYFFFERLWSIRGMENALTDFLLYPDKVRKFFRALCDFYKVIIRRSNEELHCDAIFVTDDMGSQNSLMFSPGTFRAYLKPFYKEIVDDCHRLGMHFWLHSCGNIEQILDDLIEIGVDVVHPIQKYAMDSEMIAQKYSGKICFWAGIDMQHILPEGSVEDVQAEVRRLVDIFDSPNGGLLLGAGNGITEDAPLENIGALLEEAFSYGTEHRRRYGKQRNVQ